MDEFRGYRAAIARLTGVTDPRVLGAIEEIMRIDNPTLDHLSAHAFAREARICYRVYLAMDRATAAWYEHAGCSGVAS